MNNFSKKLEEANEYSISKLDKKAQDVITEINNMFEPYAHMYLKVYMKEIQKEAFLKDLRNILNDKTGQELEELNNLHKSIADPIVGGIITMLHK